MTGSRICTAGGLGAFAAGFAYPRMVVTRLKGGSEHPVKNRGRAAVAAAAYYVRRLPSCLCMGLLLAHDRCSPPPFPFGSVSVVATVAMVSVDHRRRCR